MKLASVPLILLASLIATDQVRAERVSTRLTRVKTEDHLYSFTIKVERLKQKDASDLLEVHVVVKAKPGGHILKAHRSANLQVFNGKELVSVCPLQSTGRADALSFSFKVAAKYAERSQFTFSETVGGPEDADLFLQGYFYWFYLEDFAKAK